jgi:hypothetical protein
MPPPPKGSVALLKAMVQLVIVAEPRLSIAPDPNQVARLSDNVQLKSDINPRLAMAPAKRASLK